MNRHVVGMMALAVVAGSALRQWSATRDPDRLPLMRLAAIPLSWPLQAEVSHGLVLIPREFVVTAAGFAGGLLWGSVRRWRGRWGRRDPDRPDAIG